MKCEECSDLKVDILYGEEVPAARTYLFFRHLARCPECDGDFRELLETRESLSSWELPEEEPFPAKVCGPWSAGPRFRSMPVIYRVAAGLLMAFGLVQILHWSGVFQTTPAEVSEAQIRELVQDLIVAREDEMLKVIGSALLEIKEEMENRNKVTVDGVYSDLYTLEQKYVDALEENNRQIRRLMDR